MTKKEYIERTEKKIPLYEAGIARLQTEIETELNGKPLKEDGPDGMPMFHENFNAINKKINDRAVAIQTLKRIKEEYAKVMAEKE